MGKNIAYRTGAIRAFYIAHRRKWAEFYPSERTVFERIAMRGASFANVLDVGCAAGGLGDALMERFGTLASYTGIDINQAAADAAAAMPTRIPARRFITGDICDCPQLEGHAFDLVTALGVTDWNVDAAGILADCWKHVRANGHLVASLRLTPRADGVCEMNRSYQHIWYEPTPVPPDVERAPYHVFNVDHAIGWLAGQMPPPANIQIHGYWGKPSAQARTPFERIVFSAVAMRKPADGEIVLQPTIETDLPADALTASPAS
jgi:SAM-dependent methyltransferase